MKSGDALKRYQIDNKRLRAELAQRTKELAFFINSSKALTSTLEFDKVIRVIMERAQRLIKCDAWSLLFLDEEQQQLRFVAVKGGNKSRKGDFKKARFKVGEGIAGRVAKTGQPLMVNDVRKYKNLGKSMDRVTASRTRSVLCVPIVNKKQTIGVLEMINKLDGKPFEKIDQELLCKLVDQAAIALERANLYQSMSNLAITDDLTKLFNFRYMDQALDHEIRRSERYGSVLSLIFFDMDYFKNVNDTHGHLMGSKVLIEVAGILRENLRTVDIVSRYGGDEFVVVLPETNVATAVRITHRLHRNLRAHEFLKSEGIGMRMSASFGIAGFPEHAKTKRDLIRLADQAMYLAKNGGRDQIFVTGELQPVKRAK